MRATAAVVSLFLLLPLVARGQEVASASNAKLVGAWEMVEEQEIDSKGSILARDHDVVGMLVYSGRPHGRTDHVQAWASKSVDVERCRVYWTWHGTCALGR